jgi:eukaryotic-like serine/threonine-protein kinase
VNDTSRICPRCGATFEATIAFCARDGTRLIASGQRDLVGTVVADRYRVLSRLGEGGMGQVWLAEHVRMKRKSAIKVLRPALVGDLDSLHRFTREAENASQISHPNVAQIYDFGETADGLVYLAMEFIDGETLASKLKRELALHPDVAADVIGQACDALVAAHAQGILHRDLKPDNIMLSRRADGTFQVKLVDFGIARTLDNSEQRVTRTGFAVGTPEYMSPEQIAGETLDVRSDLYSLALVAFVALTGKDAFPNGGSKESLIARLTSRPQTLQSAKEDVQWPAELQDVFDRALAPEPNERYATVDLFAGELGNAISAMTPSQTAALYRRALEARIVSVAMKTPHGDVGLATPATPQHATPLPPEAQRRRVGPPSGSGPAVASPSAAAALATITVTDESSAPDALSPGATPSRRGLVLGISAAVAAAVVGLMLFRDTTPPVTATADRVAARIPSTTAPAAAAPPATDSTPALALPESITPIADRARADSLRVARAARRDSLALRTKAATDSARSNPPAPSTVTVQSGLAAAFPEDGIRAAFAAGAPDYRAHSVRVGNARALLLSPTLLAWRARQASAWKQANPRPDVGIPYDVVDPLEVWSGWKSTLRARRPVVVIEVLPNDAAFPRYAPAEVLDLANGDVSSAQLLRNGTPVAALQADRIPALINTDGVTAASKSVGSAVVFAVPADVFGADGSTTPGRLELQVTAGGKRSKARIDDALVRRVVEEFAPWRSTKTP